MSNIKVNEERSTSDSEIAYEKLKLIKKVRRQASLKNEDTLKIPSKKSSYSTAKFPCSHCSCKFTSIYFLNYHMRSVHKKEKRYECQHCCSKFFRLYDLKMHMNIHLKRKSYICHYCLKEFLHPSNFYRHLRIHTKIKPYTCDKCGSRFSLSQSLLKHKMSHSSDFPCPYCKLQFHTSYRLKCHIKCVHDENITLKSLSKICFKTSDCIHKFYCSFCGKRFKLKKQLQIHEKRHSYDSFPCLNCFKVYSSMSNFKIHYCIDNAIDKNKVDGRRNENNFECFHCLRILIDYEESKKHKCPVTDKNIDRLNTTEEISIVKDDMSSEIVVMNITIDENESPILSNYGIVKSLGNIEFLSKIDSKEKLDFEGKSFSDSTAKNIQIVNSTNSIHRSQNKDNLKCRYCSKVFNRLWNLQQHEGIHDPSLRKYHCTDCQQSFSFRSTYTNHLRQHASDEPGVNCSQCSKVYKTKRSLSLHIRKVHDNVRLYACSLCDKTFYDKSTFSYHLRIHNKEFPFVCYMCGKKFAHSSHLYRHERIHTSKQLHKCLYCQETYKRITSLKVHMKTHSQDSS